MSDNTTTSAYIHIPFCRSKCRYCSFVSGTDLSKKTGYLYSVLKEIDHYYRGEPLKTLYIGGGTPSVMECAELAKLINKFVLAEDCEVTSELNPNDVTSEYMRELHDIGVNRISMGAQSFDENLLKLIGRRHNVDEIYKAVETARESGFDNISLDLIYGLPTQTLKGFEHDLNEAVKLSVEHLSLYGLKIDEGSYFYEHTPDNLPDSDLQADMYLMAGEITSKSGYNHYEISNYSKQGFASRHNTNYWLCGNYYGFGVSAHGYIGDERYSNTSDLEEYLSNPTSHEYGRFLTKSEKLEEKIFLGLRLSDGIDTSEINGEFGIDFDRKYSDIIGKYLSSAHLIKTDRGYALSDSRQTNGFLLSNIILADFLER